MIGLGFGEVIGAPLFGWVQDKYGNIVASWVCLILSSLAIASGIWFTAMEEFYFSIAFVMCFMMGFQDGATQVFAQAICGFQFHNQITPFSVFQLVQNVASLFLYIGVGYLKTNEIW